MPNPETENAPTCTERAFWTGVAVFMVIASFAEKDPLILLGAVLPIYMAWYDKLPASNQNSQP